MKFMGVSRWSAAQLTRLNCRGPILLSIALCPNRSNYLNLEIDVGFRGSTGPQDADRLSVACCVAIYT